MTKPTKVLFLSVDGVLNSDLWFDMVAASYKHQKKGKYGSFEVPPQHQIDPVAALRINKLNDIRDMGVVITCNWRRNYHCKELMKKQGFRLPFHSEWRTSVVFHHSPVSVMVGDWLKQHPEIEAAAVVTTDDMSGMTDYSPIWVQTHHNIGVLAEHVDRARMLLNNETVI